MGLPCKLFGHKFVRVGEDKGICSAHECTRCGHHSPAIDWEAIARPNGMVTSDKALSLEALKRIAKSQSAPQSPQTIWSPEANSATLANAHTVVIMCEKAITREQRAEWVAHAKRSFHEGTQVLVLDAGMPFAAALTAMKHSAPFELTKRGGPIPNIPQPT